MTGARVATGFTGTGLAVMVLVGAVVTGTGFAATGTGFAVMGIGFSASGARVARTAGFGLTRTVTGWAFTGWMAAARTGRGSGAA
ncbi:MAG: hypothetical protein ABTQ27_17245, partial [Amaricoccus sp.]|uniref:hypothetical protein n=1 Tax=Amaricoccus sp. TaxID=1872485 RepID=UPI0033161F13